jgi:hypothetical protein
MPGPAGVHALLALNRRGVLTAYEFVNQFIDLAAAQADVRELVSPLPEELLVRVRQAVSDAPTTDEGWSDCLFIWGGVVLKELGPNYEAAMEQRRTNYRLGVENLRTYLTV